MNPKTNDLDSIDQTLMALVRLIKKPALWEEYCRRSKVDIDHPSIIILFNLCDGPVTFQSLVSRLGVEAPSVSRKVHELEDRGYIQRNLTTDKRVHELSLTKNGERVTKLIRSAERSILSEVFVDWTTKETQQLSIMLSRLVKDMGLVINHAKNKGVEVEQ